MNNNSLEFFARLIKAGSVSSTEPHLDTSNEAAAATVAEMLESAGFSVEMMAVPQHKGKLNIIAHAGPREPDSGLILAGHSDTVPCTEEDWQSDPFTMELRDGRLYGLGCCDMKGFFAALCEALPMIDLATLRQPLKVWATADEECGMCGARAMRAAEPAAMVLLGEPTGLVPGYAHKGAIAGKLICHGKAGHASQPAAGANAIDGIHQVLAALIAWREDELNLVADHAFDPPHQTLSFGIIRGGDAHNRICSRCELWFDCRLLPGTAPDTVFARILACAEAALADIPEITVRMNKLGHPVPAMHTALDAPVIELATTVAGRAAIALPYATEAPYYASYGMDVAILGAGHIGQVHQPDEYVEVAQIDRLAAMISSVVAKACC